MGINGQLIILSSKFYKDYDKINFPEILHKPQRAYSMFAINTPQGYTICVPFRSRILHNESFLFKTSQRSRRTKSGVDYKKIVIITDQSYIDFNATPIIDQDEYNEFITNINVIEREVIQYVNDYISFVSNSSSLSDRAANNKFMYSSLPYFHKELGI